MEVLLKFSGATNRFFGLNQLEPVNLLLLTRALDIIGPAFLVGVLHGIALAVRCRRLMVHRLLIHITVACTHLRALCTDALFHFLLDPRAALYI